MPKNRELEVAYQILGGIPDKQIDLDDIITKPGRTIGGRPFCGTVACGVGWLLQHPRYVERGFAVKKCDRCGGSCGGVLFKMPGNIHWHDESYPSVASKMLDISSDDAHHIFMPAVCTSRFNPATCVVMTDKQLLLARIRNYLRS